MRVHLAASSLVGLSTTIVGARHHPFSQRHVSQQTRSSVTKRTPLEGGSTDEKNEDSTTDSSFVKGPIWKHLNSLLQRGLNDRLRSRGWKTEDIGDPDVGILSHRNDILHQGRRLGYDDDIYDDDVDIGRDPNAFCAQFWIAFGIPFELNGTADCACYDKLQFNNMPLLRGGRANCKFMGEEDGESLCVKGACYSTFMLDYEVPIGSYTKTQQVCDHYYWPSEHTYCTTTTTELMYGSASCTVSVDDTVCQSCTVSADCPATFQVAEIHCTNTFLGVVGNPCLNDTSVMEALARVAQSTSATTTSDRPVTSPPVTLSPTSTVSAPVKTSLPTVMPTILSEPATLPLETSLPTGSLSSLISPSPTQAAVAEKTEEEEGSNASPKSSVASAWLVAIGFAASMIVVEWI